MLGDFDALLFHFIPKQDREKAGFVYGKRKKRGVKNQINLLVKFSQQSLLNPSFGLTIK